MQDDQLICEVITSTGTATFAAVNASGNLTVTGTVKAGVLQANQAGGTVQTLATGNTITVAANQSSVRVTAAGAVTGIILGAGTLAGQMLSVIHEGAAANTLTMAASGTSNVAAGATCVLSGLAAHIFIWDAVTALWYQVGPATN